MSNNYENKLLSDMLEGVHISWRKILLSKSIKPVLIECVRKLYNDLVDKGVSKSDFLSEGINNYIRPNIENIFEAFKYFDANNMVGIIIGQDPFKEKNVSTGLCFSTTKQVPVRDSTKNIYKALYRQNAISSIPDHGDLTGWAKQGILMINTYLTRTPNIMMQESFDENSPNGLIGGCRGVYISDNGDNSAKYIHKFWQTLIIKLLEFLSTVFIEKISNMRNRCIHVMLWGNHAKKLGKYINTEMLNTNIFVIHEWGHPSPANPENNLMNGEPQSCSFLNCNHFDNILINWNPSYITTADMYNQFLLTPHINEDNVLDQPVLYDDGTDNPLNLIIRKHLTQQNPGIIVGFTDGSCSKNGDDNATGSYAVYFPDSYMGQKNYVSGYICGPLEPNVILYDTDIGNVNYCNSFRKITSPRAELLGVLYALFEINKYWNASIEKVILIIDCTYPINIINEWIFSWHDSSPNFSSRENSDILVIIWSILNKIVMKYNNIHKIQDKTFKQSVNDILTITYQKSHVSKKNEHLYNPEHINGNQIADNLCNQVYSNNIIKHINQVNINR